MTMRTTPQNTETNSRSRSPTRNSARPKRFTPLEAECLLAALPRQSLGTLLALTLEKVAYELLALRLHRTLDALLELDAIGDILQLLV
jgi:hypothetical protein